MEIYSMSAQENYVGVGGWTAYHELTPKDHAVFKEALERLCGGCNTPLRRLQPRSSPAQTIAITPKHSSLVRQQSGQQS